VNDRKLNVQRNMVECPSLPNLRDEATAFLTSAKRALQFVGDVFNQFYAPDGKKPLVNNANFNYAITRLENWFQVEQLADEKVDPECPIRFRLKPLLK